MSKYVYDNHEIHEGMFVILQTLDALEGKYCGSLPDDIEEEMAQFKRHLISYVEPKDKYEENTRMWILQIQVLYASIYIIRMTL